MAERGQSANLTSSTSGTSRRSVVQQAAAIWTFGNCPWVLARGTMPCTTPTDASAPPVGAADVRRFGARGDGRSDDTAAIQRALDSLEPGQTLVFPPGIFLHSSRLVVANAGTTLWGYGATLHATNPADQALLVQASNARVLGFTMTAVTDERRHAPWESRIAIWRHGNDLAALTDVEVKDNRIIESGPPGSARANSSSSAAIFIHNVHRFVVSGNVVRRSLSDGIHITGGARHGLVEGNTVRETGDDMVAVVSYLGRAEPGAETPALIARELARRKDQELVRNVLISDNDVSGQYWGRGISVVGGEDVSIIGNLIDATTHGAGVYIAREQGWNTFGVRNVRVEGNKITRVQTTRPAYSVLPMAQRLQKAGHAAIEIVAHVFEDEKRIAELRDALTVRRVLVQNNLIEDVSTVGVRVGYGWNRQLAQAQSRADGSRYTRRFGGASISEISLIGNRFNAVNAGLEILNAQDSEAAFETADNRLDGRPMEPSTGSSRPFGSSITGASVAGCKPQLGR